MNFQSKQKTSRFTDFYADAMSLFAPADTLPATFKLRKPRLLLSQKFWLALVVVAPTLVTGLYLGVFAADQYQSQAEFIIRNPNSGTPATGLGAILSGGGLASSTRSEDDTYVVMDYIMSRDVVSLLDRNDHLREIFNRSEADPLAHFPRMPGHDSFEDLYKAYSRFVAVSYDGTSGLGTIKVDGFRADDAQKLAGALLSYSEGLVNRLNHRAEQDSMDLAKRQVSDAEQRMVAAQVKIKNFRNREMMIDPSDNGKGLFELVSKLAESAAIAKAQLLQIERTSPTSPQIAPLKDQIAALEKEVENEQAKIAGSANSMAPKVTEYEQLELEKTFAGQDLDAAHQMLQSARLQAEQQHLYLERIVEPNLADEALYPRRTTITLTVLGVSLLIFGLGWLLVAGAKEHAH